MKKIKYILFSAVILSFVFITACSTTKSVPQDDVYYSTTPHNNVTAKVTTANVVSSSVTKQQKTKQADNVGYRQGKVENISQSSGQTTSSDKYDVNYSAQLKRFHQSNDTTLNDKDNHYTDQAAQDSSRQSNTTTIVAPSFSYNLGFDSPYFGSSWSFGFGYNYGWNIGLGYGWGFPSYGWGFPSYGWGLSSYAWGYPGYGWGYPGYGWGGGYYDLGYAGWGGGYYSPYYSGWGVGYYSPYYPGFSDNGRRGGIYRPRINRGGGSSVPRSGTSGGSGVYSNHGVKSATHNADIPGTVSRKRVPVNPRGRNGKMLKPNGNNNRPVGSMRYNAAMAKKRLEDMQRRGRLNKPGGSAVRKSPDGSRSSKFGISESRNRSAEGYRKPPAYRREENMPRPRFQKPKQYQSLESRSTRSSKEFYRAPARPSKSEYRRTGTRTVYPRQQAIRRQNVYRSAGPRKSVYRSRRTRSGVRINNTSSRSFFSPNNFRAPVRKSSISRPTRSFSAPTRSFSAPTRSRTTSGSGGGGNRGGSGSGGIRH